MTVVPPAAAVAVATGVSRSRRAWARTGSIGLVVLCVLLAMSAGGQHGGETSTFPSGVKVLAMVGVIPMVALSVFLVWRGRFPTVISTIAVALTILIPTTPIPALVAIATLSAARTGWKRWLLIAGTFLAVVVSLCWDVASSTSLLSSFADKPAAGTPERMSLFWAVPVVAAVAVSVFAGYGMLRRVRSERDAARLGTVAATRNVAVLHEEVERERERQELARELHDTLAARLSTLSLHAGALEVAASGSATQAARIVRESAQASLDDLRQVVRVLRDPQGAARSRSGLSELGQLIDGAIAEGTDVRALVLLTDPESCDPQVAHACYRLVQESISNARRHAPGAAVRVEVRGASSTGLTVTAANWLSPGIPSSSHPDGAGAEGHAEGHGLIGMSERVALVGGSFQAGPTPEGTFAVIAWMPWAAR